MNRRNLRWDEFVAGERYRVYKKPEHLRGVCYPYIGNIGECVWSHNYHGVQMRFPNSIERLIPIDCLEEVGESSTEKPKKELNISDIKIGELYRIETAPNFWVECHELYADLGRIGKLIKLTPNTSDPKAILELAKNKQRIVPLKNLAPVRILIPPPAVVDLSDDILINIILENPKGFLKIVKGLAKMNKEPRLKSFLERGLV